VAYLDLPYATWERNPSYTIRKENAILYILYISDPSASIADALLTFLDDDASLDTILKRPILRSVALKRALNEGYRFI